MRGIADECRTPPYPGRERRQREQAPFQYGIGQRGEHVLELGVEVRKEGLHLGARGRRDPSCEFRVCAAEREDVECSAPGSLWCGSSKTATRLMRVLLRQGYIMSRGERPSRLTIVRRPDMPSRSQMSSSFPLSFETSITAR